VTYTLLAVLGVGLALAVDWLVYRTRLVATRVFWVSYAIVLLFQLISNGVLTGRGVVRYDPDAIIGWRLAYAPVEDLLFGFALVLLTLASWTAPERSRRGARGRRPPG
jgi:lycopene cyclase domain-containing protein